MLRLRPYKNCDAEKISEWIKDKDVFVKWGGDHFTLREDLIIE